MKIYKLAHNTIENKDYEVLIDFLKRRSYPNHANINKVDIDYIAKCFKSVAKPVFFNRSKNI